MKTVVGLGEVLWDLYPDARYSGGAPANVALHAAQLGARAVIASSVGIDEEGDTLIEAIRQQGGEIRHIQKNFLYGTGRVTVTVNDGIPSFECSTDTAFDHLIWNDDLLELAKSCDAVVYGTLAQRDPDSETTIQHFLREADSALKAFDVNFRGWHDRLESIIRQTLEHSDIIKMNEEELVHLRQVFHQNSLSDAAFLMWLSNTYSLKLAALTLGPAGCIVATRNHVTEAPGKRVHVVDTTGCGDAFLAGLVIQMMGNASLEKTARFANALGAFVATRQGAVPKYTLEEIEL
jgi:fructokinase